MTDLKSWQTLSCYLADNHPNPYFIGGEISQNLGEMSFPQQAFTFRSASSPSWPAGRNENDGLCNECVKLDLEESFANAFALYEGARRGRNTRKLEVYRSDDGPAYLGYFYYVTSLGDRLSRATLCKLCNFLKQTCPDPSKGTYKLLAIYTSEIYLFKVPKKANRSRPEKRPWGEVEHNLFMAVVPEVPLIPKIGIPLRWLRPNFPRTGQYTGCLSGRRMKECDSRCRELSDPGQISASEGNGSTVAGKPTSFVPRRNLLVHRYPVSAPSTVRKPLWWSKTGPGLRVTSPSAMSGAHHLETGQRRFSTPWKSRSNLGSGTFGSIASVSTNRTCRRNNSSSPRWTLSTKAPSSPS